MSTRRDSIAASLAALASIATVLLILATIAGFIYNGLRMDNATPATPAPIGHPITSLDQATQLARSLGTDPEYLSITEGDAWHVLAFVEHDDPHSLPWLRLTRGYCLDSGPAHTYLVPVDFTERPHYCELAKAPAFTLDTHGVWQYNEPPPPPPLLPTPGRLP